MKLTCPRAAVVALVLALPLAACGGGDDGPDLVSNGTKVDQASLESSLTAAEKALTKTAKDGHGVTADPVRCWAEGAPPVDGKQALTGNAFCGPVLFPASSPSKFWAVYDLDLANAWDQDAGETIAKTGKPTLTTAAETVATDPASSYVRPDGDAMPDKSGLEVPPPPPAPVDLVATDINPKDLKLAKPADDRLEGLGASFLIHGTGTIDQVPASDGDSPAAAYGPPKSGELFAVSLTLGGNANFLRHAAIEVDGKEIQSWDAGDGYNEGDEALVFAVEDKAPIELVLEENKGGSVDPTTDPIVQHYDLRTGRVTDPIVVLYRNREADPIKSVDIPCTWTPYGKTWDSNSDGPCTERFEAEASLTYSYPLSSYAEIDSDYLVPKRDQAVLVVDTSQSEAWLVDAKGKRIEPINPNTDDSDQGEWAFLVDAKATEFTLVTNTDSGQEPYDYDKEKGIDHKTTITIPT